jgi:AcrR family transcriptional regulator
MQNSTDKRAQIIEAAENLFHRFGYSKASLDDIAREASLGKGTIYYYFESKEDIFLEVAKVHGDYFYQKLQSEIDKCEAFADKFSTAIRLPVKLVYEHAPVLLDAIKNLPDRYLQKLEDFRVINKQKILSILQNVMNEGIKQNVMTDEVPAETVVSIIFDWFLLGDSNIIIKNPGEFIKKAEADYEWIVKLMLNGILKRG